jgi:hypothetical protein
MRKRRKKHAGAALLPGCYLLALAVFLAVHLAGFIQNRLAYASGRLAYAELVLDDLDLAADLTLESGVLLTDGYDPQLTLADRGMRVETLRLVAGYSRQPLVQTVFWAAPGHAYSPRRMAYPHSIGPEGSLFLLPPGGGQGIRLDPDTVPGNRISIEKVIVNEKRPIYLFFLPSSGEVALLAALPALAACALWLGGGLLRLGRPARVQEVTAGD